MRLVSVTLDTIAVLDSVVAFGIPMVVLVTLLPIIVA